MYDYFMYNFYVAQCIYPVMNDKHSNFGKTPYHSAALKKKLTYCSLYWTKIFIYYPSISFYVLKLKSAKICHMYNKNLFTLNASSSQNTHYKWSLNISEPQRNGYLLQVIQSLIFWSITVNTKIFAYRFFWKFFIKSVLLNFI